MTPDSGIIASSSYATSDAIQKLSPRMTGQLLSCRLHRGVDRPRKHAFCPLSLTEAVASYDMALVIHPDNIDAWKNRGFALYNFKRYRMRLPRMTGPLPSIPVMPMCGSSADWHSGNSAV